MTNKRQRVPKDTTNHIRLLLTRIAFFGGFRHECMSGHVEIRTKKSSTFQRTSGFLLLSFFLGVQCNDGNVLFMYY